MSRLHLHPDFPVVSRIGWLRAAMRRTKNGDLFIFSHFVAVAAAGTGVLSGVVA